MNMVERLVRAAIGLVVVALLLIVGFAYVLQIIPTWGATPDEVALSLPGDEIVPNPLVNWTHAITIDAPSNQVWGWIAQIGEQRGAYYSYTFIENRMGNGDVYHNADRIVPEWQNPAPGTVMIANAMELKALEPGKWYLGSSTNEMGWTWLWYLEPMDASHTRLIVRSHIQPPGSMTNGAVGMGISLGGFVMEQAMLQGIQARAEGNIPPAYTETLELALWILALAAGIVAGVLFVASQKWIVPLGLGMLAIIAIFIFTFWQPSLWTRVVIELVLYAGLIWFATNYWGTRMPRTRSRNRNESLRLKPLAK